MKTIKEVIVVEGNSDIITLSKIIQADFIKTNGLGITQKTIDLIKKSQETRGVILFLDPDSPGEKIRRLITSQVKDVKHAFIEAKYAKGNGKLGVAEADPKQLLIALENVISFKESNTNLLTMNDLITLGLSGDTNAAQKRLIIEGLFHLGHGSAKTMLKRLNMLGISLEELKKKMEEI